MQTIETHLREILHAIANGDLEQRLEPTGDEELDRSISCIVANLRAGTSEHESQLADKGRAEALDLNSIGSWEWDVPTGVVTWSAKTYEIMGLASTDSPSYDVALSHVHPEDRERYEKALTECVEVTGEYTLQNRIVHSDGSIRHVLAHGRLHHGADNQPIRMFGTMQDVTDAHDEGVRVFDLETNALAAQKHLEEQAPLIVEASPVAMIMVDRENRIILLNSKSEELFGYARSELLGKRIEILVPDHLGEIHRRHRETYWENPEPRAMARNRELHGRHKDGTLVPVEIALSAIETPEGTRVLAAVVDLSAHKHLEEQVRRAQKLEAIGTLASGMAHDFNNLLMGVSGCAAIAISTLESGGSPLVYLHEIQKAAQSGAAISNQLLAFSRKSKANVAVFDLNAVVTGMQLLLGRLLGADIEISLRIAAESARVLADRGLMEQVLMNLVINARDAMPSGGCVAIETRNVLLSEPNGHALPAGEYVVLVVTDSGTGMTEEVSQRIFEPFFTTKESGRGTGLGLSIVYGVIKEARGQINVQSQAKQGTTFEILLPATLELPTTAPEELVGGHEAQIVGTILLVEDAPAVLMAVRFYLEEAGHKVLEAASGAEAVEVCERYKERVDLVLSDVVMPGLSGAETIREIRKLRPEIDVVYMSAHDSAWLVEHGRIEPSVQTLQKPFGSDELLSRVRETLDRRSAAAR